jgi:hypothetical protein
MVDADVMNENLQRRLDCDQYFLVSPAMPLRHSLRDGTTAFAIFCLRRLRA